MSEASLQAVVADEASAVFLGRWNRLISTTNWEKGRIILQWREALIVAGAPATDYSDEAWSERVGGVSGQHVGRLRRVFERFDAGREQYPHLFWSHFQAAVDWNDAEMWLEGGVQSDWSVAEMRRRRAETLGLNDGEPNADESPDINQFDEDAGGVDAGVNGDGAHRAALNGEFAVETRIERQRRSSDPESDEAEADEPPFASGGDDGGAHVPDPSQNGAPREPFRPFANLADLPDDLHDAFEAMKLAILRHKLAEWQDVSRDDLVAAIGALRELALVED